MKSKTLLEGHPTYLSDNNHNNYMGAIIHSKRKKEMLSFLKGNFGKISEREMARKLKIGKTTTNRWCKELNLNPIIHTVNESFFEKWSNEMSYILGYIFADGNINWNEKKSYRALTITAAEKDKNHLETVRNKLNSTKPLFYSKNTNSYRLIVNSKKLCLDLMKIGITPRKSLTADFPKIPNKFLKDFIRGVIDGDGCIRYVERERSPYFEIQIATGSKKFAKSLTEIISKTIGVETIPRKMKGTNTFIIQYTCKRALKLAKWVYEDSNIFLKRKFKAYEKALKSHGGDES